jgi:hypothetical protein
MSQIGTSPAAVLDFVTTPDCTIALTDLQVRVRVWWGLGSEASVECEGLSANTFHQIFRLDVSDPAEIQLQRREGKKPPEGASLKLVVPALARVYSNGRRIHSPTYGCGL